MKTKTWVVLPLMLFGCSLPYVMKQGVFQLELLTGSKPIEKALRSADLDLKKRKKLELIQDVRAFAKRRLGLKAHNYQDVNLSWDHSLHTVSACKEAKFEPYRWWFPIIGFVPYKGFFDKTDAFLEQKKLKDQGFDTQIGRVSGYSTLGFFSDPVWPSMLDLEDEALIDLIIHELTHETLYIAGQTTFNETLASYVARMGTELYTKEKFGEKSPKHQGVLKYHRDHGVYQQFFFDLTKKLEKLYGSDLTNEQKLLKKREILTDAQKRYQQLDLKEPFSSIDWSRVNNAYLMSFKSYNSDDRVLAELLSLMDKDFGRFFFEIDYFGRSKDPFKSMSERVLELKGRADGKA